MKLRELERVTDQSIRNAGPRYTPGQDPTFPNLHIAELDEAIVGVVGGKPFQERVNSLRDRLLKQFEENKTTLATAFPRRVREPKGCLQGLADIATARLGEGRDSVSKTKRAVSRTLATYRTFERELFELRSARRDEIEADRSNEDAHSYLDDDPAIRRIDSQLLSLRNYLGTLQDVHEFLDSACCRAQFTNSVLMVGEWGSGKTHYLCDVARNRLSEGQPALLVLAKDFEPSPSACEALVSHTGLSRTISTLVRGLGRRARRGERALLIIDGVNESDEEAWRADVKVLFDLVSENSNVALIVSSRSPMHLGIIPKSIERRMLQLDHPGFSEIEFDAQQNFFDYYDVPLPEVPMLADEFSRPLTLKILCEAFKTLPERAQRAGFAGLSSGQRGMTTILERFIHERARDIEIQLGLSSGFCWSLMKGDTRIQDKLDQGLAPYMAATGKNFVAKSDVLRMLTARTQLQNLEVARRFYRRILAEGLLVESELWRSDDDGGPVTVVRMPYERFGDHIVARHLLGEYLDTRSEATIRRSLYRHTPIGSLFELHNGFHYQYRYEGWIEALIVEFPERVKRTLPSDATELFFYLPKARQSLSAYWERFCDGLFWRYPGSFSRQTDLITGELLWGGHESSSRKMIDALLAVSTKPAHPYSAVRLLENFSGMDMVKRDLLWSEYLRNRFHSSSADRLVNWFERPISSALRVSSVENLVSAFSLFLTTTDRKLRDRVTKILVRLGERYPRVLFERTLHSLSFNDPYVPERMLAASYGAAMALWADRSERVFRREILPFAKQLIRRMYLPNGDFRTPHVLMREYSLGLIQIAQLIHPNKIATQWIPKIRPPFASQSSPFDDAEVCEAYSEEAKSAIQLDFGNYTIGGLISGRQNYDYENADYVDVRGKIDWRICDLGYRKSLFDVTDQIIGRDSWRSSQGEEGKVDRYGKKYSWIAYFEMYGVRQAAGLLPDYRQDERTSDCDIDPSFPKRTPRWNPPAHNFFRRVPAADIEWIKRGPSPRFGRWLIAPQIDKQSGPWVLLNGHVRDEDSVRGISSFAFLRGFLVDTSDVEAITKAIKGEDHPASGLPNTGEDHYTFAGEIPWSPRFAASSKTREGLVTRHEASEAFYGSRTIQEKQRVKRAWQLVYDQLGEIPEINPIRVVDPESDAEDEAFRTVSDAIESANQLVSQADRIDISDLIAKKPTVEEVQTGYQLVQRWEHVPGYSVYPTSWRYAWESYHSVVNEFSGFEFPAPILCDLLGLEGRNRCIDLVDRSGQRATMYRGSRDQWSKSHNVIYLRQDLLDEFLEYEQKSLLWLIWGERGFTTDRAPSMNRQPAVLASLRSHEHVFRRVNVYKPA